MGFAASHAAWAPQLADLLAAPGNEGGGDNGGCARSPCVVCALDNRGVGKSASPPREDYSTAAMADDALQARPPPLSCQICRGAFPVCTQHHRVLSHSLCCACSAMWRR